MEILLARLKIDPPAYYPGEGVHGSRSKARISCLICSGSFGHAVTTRPRSSLDSRMFVWGIRCASPSRRRPYHRHDSCTDDFWEMLPSCYHFLQFLGGTLAVGSG